MLRCTSFRCVRLRRTVAALPPPDQSLHSAFRRRPWIKIKSGTRANAHRVGAAEGCDLLILPLLFCGSEPARESGLTADHYPPAGLNPCGRALELTLIVEWCGFTAGSCAVLLFCGSELAREGGLTADHYLPAGLNPCGSWLASDGSLQVDQSPTDIPDPNVGASLLAKAPFQTTSSHLPVRGNPCT